MADENRKLTLDLLARNKMGQETKAAADDLDKLGKAADRAGEHTEKLGRTSEVTGKEADKLGRDVKDTKDKIESLDREIKNSTRELGLLAVAFAEAGSAAERMDISKSIRRTETDIRRTGKAKGLLEDLLPDPSEGVSLGRKLGDSVADGLAGAPKLAVAGGIIGAALAPTLGAAVAGAVVGGIGMGGLIGGIALAVKSNADIQDYGKRIGASFTTGIKNEAKDAFNAPIMESLGKVEALAARSVPKIGKIFTSLAPQTSKLTDSLVRVGDTLLDSLVGASSKAAPAMEALDRIIESTGSSLAGFIDMAASHSKEGASALDDLNGALQSMISVATTTVDALATIKGGLDNFDGGIDKVRYHVEDFFTKLSGGRAAFDITADGYDVGTKAADLYRQGIIGAKGAINDYDHYLKGAVDSTNSLATAQTNEQQAANGQREALAAVSKELRAQADPAFALLNAQDKVAASQEALTRATGKYGSESTQARKAARDLATSSLELQGAAGTLSSTFNGQLSPAMEATFRSAGLTKGQIAAIREEFKRAKGAGESFAKDYVANVITRYVNVQVSSGNQGIKAFDKRAAGGPVSRGTPYLVGEHGPEVVVPTAAGRVLSAAATRGMARSGGGRTAGGFPPGGVTARLEVVGQEQMRTMLRYMIRSMNLLQDN